MGANRVGRTSEQGRSAWEAPAVTKVAIGTETKSAPHGEGKSLEAPRPPSSPATKLGFSFEMAFPMSARSEK
jgi:hypothetical protein